MRTLALCFALLACVLHIAFFAVEAFAPHLLLKANPEQLNNSVKLFAFNQGFYNLFLALGGFYGVFRAYQNQGTPDLLVFILLAMLGASLVLFGSNPNLLRGVLAQGVPPLISLIFFWISQRP
jgi:putative membrane protein